MDLDWATLVPMIGAVAYMIFEYWAGETDKVEGNSLLALLRDVLKFIAGKK